MTATAAPILLSLCLAIIGATFGKDLPLALQHAGEPPVVDMYIQVDGAKPTSVATEVIEPLERALYSTPGLDELWSESRHGEAIIRARFSYGTNEQTALETIQSRLSSAASQIDGKARITRVTVTSSDDIPIMTVSLWSKQTSVADLHGLALYIQDRLKLVPGIGRTQVIGGPTQTVSVDVLPERLSGFNVTLVEVANTIQKGNLDSKSGFLISDATIADIVSGNRIKDVREIKELIVGGYQGFLPVRIEDIAEVYSTFGEQTRFAYHFPKYHFDSPKPCVTIAIGRAGTISDNSLANHVIAKVSELTRDILPKEVQVEYSLNQGSSATDAALRILSAQVIWLFVTFAAISAIFHSMRLSAVILLCLVVTAFASTLLFSAVTDLLDPIVLVGVSLGMIVCSDILIGFAEDLRNTWIEEESYDQNSTAASVQRYSTVATFSVLCSVALLPTFLPLSGALWNQIQSYLLITGLMLAAILLVCRFIAPPWLRWATPPLRYLRDEKERRASHRRRIKLVLDGVESVRTRYPALYTASILVVTIGGFLFLFHAVLQSRLSLDPARSSNQSALVILIDTPTGTAPESNANLAFGIAKKLQSIDLVESIQAYVGLSGPVTATLLNRMQHDRSDPWNIDLRVKLADNQNVSSRLLRKQIREILEPVLAPSHARIASITDVADPPASQDIIVTFVGSDRKTRTQVARDVGEIFRSHLSSSVTSSVIPLSATYWRFEVNAAKASTNGITVADITQNLALAASEYPLGEMAGTKVPIVMRIPLATRSLLRNLASLPIRSVTGAIVPLDELGEFNNFQEQSSVLRRNSEEYSFVSAETTSDLVSPGKTRAELERIIAERLTTDGHEPASGSGASLMGTSRQIGYRWTGDTEERSRALVLLSEGALASALLLIFVARVVVGNWPFPVLLLIGLGVFLLSCFLVHAGLGARFSLFTLPGFLVGATVFLHHSFRLYRLNYEACARGLLFEDGRHIAFSRQLPIVLVSVAILLVYGVLTTLFGPFDDIGMGLVSVAFVLPLILLLIVPQAYVRASRLIFPDFSKAVGRASGDEVGVARIFFRSAGYDAVEGIKGRMLKLRRTGVEVTDLAVPWIPTDFRQIVSRLGELAADKNTPLGKVFLMYGKDQPPLDAIFELKAVSKRSVIPTPRLIIQESLEGRDPVEALSSLESPYLILRDPYVTRLPIQDPVWFFGRSTSLREISDLLLAANNVGIFGLRRIGKTSVINMLKHLIKPSPITIVDCQGLPSPHTAKQYFDVILESLYTQLKDTKGVGLLMETRMKESFSMQVRELHLRWLRAGNNGPFVIVFDEIEVFFKDRERPENVDVLKEYVKCFQVLRSLNQEYRSVALAVVGYRPSVNRFNILREDVGDNPMFNSFQEYFLGSLTRPESHKLVRDIGRWTDISWDEGTLDRIFDDCAGHPLVTKLFASEITEKGRRKKVLLEHVIEAEQQVVGSIGRNIIGNYFREGVWETLTSAEQAALSRALRGTAWTSIGDQNAAEHQEALESLEKLGLIEFLRDEYRITPKFFADWLSNIA